MRALVAISVQSRSPVRAVRPSRLTHCHGRATPPSDAAPSTREVHSIGKYTIDPIGRSQGLGQGSPLRKASSFRSISIIFTTFIHGADKFQIEILVVCRVS